jgi:Tol biopolymer transport system component
MRSSLRTGTTLSHYRVLGPLAAGGMGEVYKAEDTTLGRTIALKILRPDLVRSRERVQRFMQEARSASSLNHPHIVTVHEVGEAVVTPDGDPDAGPPSAVPVLFIAMEYVDGETLAAKIHSGKTDLRTLLGYLTQAAEGLAKAHAAGIVHRDLKPENIMITRDGYAKVLDFGLAKLSELTPSAEDLSAATRAVRSPTREGAVLGTVGYMSPEQVQGKPLDHRSDIFSFGCILFEAATGRRPFEGDSDIDVMHRIMHDKPLPIDQLNPSVPAELRRLIRRCLAKDPERRLQSMKDLAIELADIVSDFDELSPASSSGSSGQSALGAAPARPARGGRIALAIGALGVLALIVAAFLASRRGPAGGREDSQSAFHSMRMTNLTGSGRARGAAISPDGKYVAYVNEEAGKQSLWMRQVATGSDVQVGSPGNPFGGLTFSPDGNYVYYTRNQSPDGRLYSILYRVPALGGEPAKLIFDIDTRVAMSPDGTQLAFVRGYPTENLEAIMVANADGSGERRLATSKRPARFLLTGPAWSPDGKLLAAVAGGPEDDIEFIVTLDVATGEQARVGDRRWLTIEGLAWLPDGTGLVVGGFGAGQRSSGPGAVSPSTEDDQSPQVWLVDYPGGEAHRVTNDLNAYQSISVTADGKSLVTVQRSAYANLWIVPIGAGDNAGRRVTTGRREFIDQIRWCPSGRIVCRAQREGVTELWTFGPDGSDGRRLDVGPNLADPMPTADGQRILFTSGRGGGAAHVWKIDSDGGQATQLTNGPGEALASMDPQGRWFYYRLVGSDGSVWCQALDPGDVPRRVLAGFDILALIVSRSGRQISYLHFESQGDRLEVRVSIAPIDEQGNIEAAVTTFDPHQGIIDGKWGKNDQDFTYLINRDGVANIWVEPKPGDALKPLTHFESGSITSFDYSPDFKQLAIGRGEALGDVVMMSDFR